MSLLHTFGLTCCARSCILVICSSQQWRLASCDVRCVCICTYQRHQHAWQSIDSYLSVFYSCRWVRHRILWVLVHGVHIRYWVEDRAAQMEVGHVLCMTGIIQLCSAWLQIYLRILWYFGLYVHLWVISFARATKTIIIIHITRGCTHMCWSTHVTRKVASVPPLTSYIYGGTSIVLAQALCIVAFFTIHYVNL